MIWYKKFPADYLGKTPHLSLAEHGAYNVMLDIVYATERPLPKDRAAVYRLLRAFDPDERKAVNSVLDEFWEETPGGWTNAKADQVMAEARGRSDMARKSANRRWRNDANADANALRPQSEGNAVAVRTQSEGTCESVCESDANQKSEARLQSQEEKAASALRMCRSVGSDGRNNTPWSPAQDSELLAIPNRDADAMFAFSKRAGKAVNSCINRRAKLRRRP